MHFILAKFAIKKGFRTVLCSHILHHSIVYTGPSVSSCILDMVLLGSVASAICDDDDDVGGYALITCMKDSMFSKVPYMLSGQF